ncbi:hypothetical protein IAE23_29380 [Bacillus sp. S35]|nr:hypothetical protein [Bacillus sp. S35]
MSLKARLKKVEAVSQKLKKPEPVKEVINPNSLRYWDAVSLCAFGYWEACLKYAKSIDKRRHVNIWGSMDESKKGVILKILQEKQPERTIIKDLGARYDFEVFNDNVLKAYSYLDAVEKGEPVDPPEIEDILEMPDVLRALWPDHEEKRSCYQKCNNL